MLNLTPSIVAAAALCCALAAGGATWKVQEWRYDARIADLKANASSQEAAQAKAALTDLKTDLDKIHDSALAADATIKTAVAAINKDWKKHAPALPDNCKPDPVRVRNLATSIDAANQAITGQ